MLKKALSAMPLQQSACNFDDNLVATSQSVRMHVGYQMLKRPYNIGINVKSKIACSMYLNKHILPSK